MKNSKIAGGVVAILIGIALFYYLSRNHAPAVRVLPAPPASSANAPSAAPAAKIEAPKIAPAPAGGGLATDNTQPDLNQLSGSRGVFVLTGKNSAAPGNLPQPNSPGPTVPAQNNAAGAKNTPATWPEVIAERRALAEQSKALWTQIVARETAEANGDPDKLAQMEPARQQYEAALQKERDVDALETDPAARAEYAAKMRAQLEEIKKTMANAVKQTTAKANGDPAQLAQADALQKVYDEQLKQVQQAVENLEATAQQ